MKYESTILKRLIDTYGVVGNHRYISEIIKEFIVRGKERFPELFTCQADWLAHIDEFGLNPTYTVTYTGQSIYAPNTLERPVKSAILSGMTLVNLHPAVYGIKGSGEGIFYVNVNLTKDLFETNTKYLVRLYNTDSAIKRVYMKHCVTNTLNLLENNCAIFTTKSKFDDNEFTNNKIHFYSDESLSIERVANTKVLICEYQDGMENWDIPYFEGMQSVKLPVLTTSNEDGTKTNILSTSEDIELRGIGDVQDTLDCLTGEVTERIGEIVLDGSEDWSHQTEAKGYIVYKLPLNDIDASVSNSKANCLCDKYSVKTWFEIYTEDNDKTFSVLGNQQIRVQFNGSLEELKHWLSETKPTLQFLKTPTIKTVDLTILDQNGQSVDHLKSFNGGTHVYTSSLEGSLVPSVDISVVTNLEETLKICSLEGNTM